MSDGLRRVHRVIAVMLREHEDKLPDYVCGFRSGGSIRKHATPHCAQARVAVADIRSFFQTITEERITQLFIELGAAENVSITLARLASFEDRLPEGARSSPTIANLVAARLDRRIMSGLVAPWTYTRYADDLAFSGQVVPTENQLRQWLGEEGFELKPNSYRVRTPAQGPYVTGLWVGGDQPRVPRKRRRLIERTLRRLENSDYEAALLAMYDGASWQNRSSSSQLAHLASLIESVRVVENAGENWRERLAAILEVRKQLAGGQDVAATGLQPAKLGDERT